MSKKRITVKLKTPNPLFERWLIEWRDEAKAKDSKMQYCFSMALQSLKRYPIPLESGRDCKILKGFGDKLCNMLDEKLKRHKSGELDGIDNNLNANVDDNNENIIKVVKKPVKTKNKVNKSINKNVDTDYTPQYRSGGYAILIALIESKKESLSKKEIIDTAQFYCDSSFKNVEPGSFYTAWSSMGTLINKHYVIKESSPAKYSLTDQGKMIAKKLFDDILKNNELEPKGTLPDVSDLIQGQIINQIDLRNPLILMENTKDCLKSTTSVSKSTSSVLKSTSSASKSTSSVSKSTSSVSISTSSVSKSTPSVSKSTFSTISSFETLIFEPNSFEIILLVDTAETSGKDQAKDDPILIELNRLNVNHEVRHLKVGDYLWICRHKVTKKELVLPYIIERKRMDDFGRSIKDGRYHEQKFRLNQCGIQNVIYLVESFGKNVHVGLPMTSLMQAAVNTMVQDGFMVKFSDNTRSTGHYLNTMSKVICKNYLVKTVISCPKENLEPSNFHDDLISLLTFGEFMKIGAMHKDFTVKEMFIKHLLQLKGLSIDKALAIVDKYPTPRLLIEAYNQSVNNEGEKLISSITFGKGTKTIGPVISQVIYRLYS